MSMKKIYLFVMAMVLFPCHLFSQTEEEITSVDTVYNPDGTFEHGIMQGNKRVGTWYVKGTAYHSYTKEYNGDTIYVEINDRMNDLFSMFYMRVHEGSEEKNGSIRQYYKDCLYIEGEFVNDKRVNKWTYYDLDGAIVKNEIYRAGNDTIAGIHYNSGLIAEMGNYLYNQGKIGQWYEFHPNGRIKSLGKYSGGFVFVDKPFDETTMGSEIIYNKDGVWLYWNNEGHLTKKEIHMRGELIRIKEY